MAHDDDGKGSIRLAAVFFLLTLAWSGTCWGILVLTGREWMSGPGIILFTLGGVGPTLVTAVLVAMGYGVEPPGRFWRRAIDFRRIPPAWYVVMLVLAFVPNAIARLFPGGSGVDLADGLEMALLPFVAVIAGLVEEPGWRGFALDHLIGKMSGLVASLVIGVVWMVFHLPLYGIEGFVSQEEGFGSFKFWADMVAILLLGLLYAWIVLNTDRSILAAILVHAVGNIGLVVMRPDGDTQVFVRLVILVVFCVLVVRRWGPDLQRDQQGMTPGGARPGPEALVGHDRYTVPPARDMRTRWWVS